MLSCQKQIYFCLHLNLNISIVQFIFHWVNPISFFLAWNLVQTELTCCGVNDPSDWHQSKAKKRPFLPESCCKAVQINSMCRIDNQLYGPYEKGCLEAFSDFLHSNAGVIGALIAVVAFIQIAVILVTVKLMKNTKKPDHCYPFY